MRPISNNLPVAPKTSADVGRTAMARVGATAARAASALRRWIRRHVALEVSEAGGWIRCQGCTEFFDVPLPVSAAPDVCDACRADGVVIFPNLQPQVRSRNEQRQ